MSQNIILDLTQMADVLWEEIEKHETSNLPLEQSHMKTKMMSHSTLRAEGYKIHESIPD